MSKEATVKLSQGAPKTMHSKAKLTTKQVVMIGLMSALAYVLMLLESPPYLGFLRIEFSDVPAIISGFAYGPVAGVFVELIKNLLKVISNTKTIGAGEMANFIVGCAYVIPLSIIYRKMKAKGKGVYGVIAGTIVMCIAGILANRFITLPWYANMFGGMENLIGMVQGMTPSFLPKIQSLWGVIIIGITPFNVVKGALIGFVSLVVYKIVRRRIDL